MFCPKCGYEYQEGFAICKDCNVALKKRKPKFIIEEEKNADSFTRLASSLLDLFIISCIIIALYYFNKQILNFQIEDITTYQIVLFFFILLWLYSTLFESSKYKGTIGKIIFRLCVVDKNCLRISFLRATIRFILKLVLGLFIIRQMLIDTDTTFWYDSVSETKIVYKKYC